MGDFRLRPPAALAPAAARFKGQLNLLVPINAFSEISILGRQRFVKPGAPKNPKLLAKAEKRRAVSPISPYKA